MSPSTERKKWSEAKKKKRVKEKKIKDPHKNCFLVSWKTVTFTIKANLECLMNAPHRSADSRRKSEHRKEDGETTAVDNIIRLC